jgi:hypothetical protein
MSCDWEEEALNAGDKVHQISEVARMGPGGPIRAELPRLGLSWPEWAQSGPSVLE